MMKFPRTKQSGSIVIEAAFVLPLLLFIVFSALELSRALIVRVSLDHAISEATRQIKLEPASNLAFNSQLIAHIKRQSFGTLNSDLIEVKPVKVFKSPTDLLAGIETPNAVSALALYQVNYQFSTISPWLKVLSFSSKVLVKHER